MRSGTPRNLLIGVPVSALWKQGGLFVAALAAHTLKSGMRIMTSSPKFSTVGLSWNDARPKRDSELFTVILFDIDHFKTVNDMYGHNAGDQVLAHVAKICKSSVTDDILFPRYGGEEFVLALFGRTLSEGKEFAERLREKIASQPLTVEGRVIFVTSSVGVAETSGNTVESLQHLLRRADEALYAAKRSGGNRVSVYAKQSGRNGKEGPAPSSDHASVLPASLFSGVFRQKQG
jgi:diguanylate cyclase (GGDEF)-like protein